MYESAKLDLPKLVYYLYHITYTECHLRYVLNLATQHIKPFHKKEECYHCLALSRVFSQAFYNLMYTVLSLVSNCVFSAFNL